MRQRGGDLNLLRVLLECQFRHLFIARLPRELYNLFSEAHTQHLQIHSSERLFSLLHIRWLAVAFLSFVCFVKKWEDNDAWKFASGFESSCHVQIKMHQSLSTRATLSVNKLSRAESRSQPVSHDNKIRFPFSFYNAQTHSEISSEIINRCYRSSKLLQSDICYSAILLITDNIKEMGTSRSLKNCLQTLFSLHEHSS